MRCKNCGAENDDSRFICANCGSPLYDEDEEIIAQTDEELDNQNNNINNQNSNNNDDNNKKKKQIIIITSIIVAVVVIAIIVGVCVHFASGSIDSESETSDTSFVQTTESTTKKVKKTTTEPSTETTTQEITTTTTTTTKSYAVVVDIDGNGSATGDGSYNSGKKASLVAKADEGYQFEGWYDNDTGMLVASSSRYTVTVNENLNLTAKFSKLAEPETQETTENTGELE